jgi:hypothetical protein
LPQTSKNFRLTHLRPAEIEQQYELIAEGLKEALRGTDLSNGRFQIVPSRFGISQPN